MGKTILAALLTCVLFFAAGSAFALQEKESLQKCQIKIAACMQKIKSLENKIEALEAASQKKGEPNSAQPVTGGQADIRYKYDRDFVPFYDY